MFFLENVRGDASKQQFLCQAFSIKKRIEEVKRDKRVCYIRREYEAAVRYHYREASLGLLQTTIRLINLI